MDHGEASLADLRVLDAPAEVLQLGRHVDRLGGKDEAEHAARELLLRYPEVHDGYDRLGMVHEARAQFREAADCYRKVIEFANANPEDYDPGLIDSFCERIKTSN